LSEIAAPANALNCPLGQVKEALAACGVPTLIRRDMPREVLVYFVMAMCLYPRVAYEEVLRLVIEGLRRIYGDEVSEAGRAVQSRGKSNPRGVKRKMSNFRIRRRSEPLNQRITPTIVIK
jgi:hypothetical protein